MLSRPCTRARWTAAAAFVQLATAGAAAQEPGWTAAGTRAGVTLAFRDDAGMDAREARATAELRFPADRIAATACDFTNYPALDPDVREARVLSGTVGAAYEIYLR